MNQKIFFILFLFISALSFQKSWGQSYEVDKTLAGHAGAVQNMRFSPDGKFIATGGLNDFKVIIWDVETGKQLHKLSGHTQAVYEVSFSPNGLLLASASKDGSVMVWNTETGVLKGLYHTLPKVMMGGSMALEGGAVFVCFSKTGQYIYFGGTSGDIYRAKLGTDANGMFHPVEILANANPSNTAMWQITGGAITPDGKGVMVSINQLVRVFDLSTGALIKNFYYPYSYLNDVVAAPDGQVATWSYDGFVTIWDYTTSAIVKRLQVTVSENYSAASFSADGEYLSTGAFGSSARVWKWKEDKLISNLSGHSRIVRMTRFHPHEHLIASASYDGTVKLWKPKEEEPEEELVEITPPAPVPAPTPTVKKEPVDNSEVTKIEAPKPSLTEKELIVGKSVEMKNIQFQQASYELTEQAKIDLDEVLKLMKAHPRLEIEIHGHTDNIGRSDLNLKLSERRTIVSRNYLVNKGISESRIGIKAFGDTKPITDNSTEAKRKRNRRIEILIVKK